MTEAESLQAAGQVELSARIVTAYVANNSISTNEIGNLLISIHAAVKGLSHGGANASAERVGTKLTRAQIKRSITPDSLISFEDGKAYKTLGRHLRSRGLTPEEYRAKWGLPSDYPMTAASYVAARSELARSIGLGQPKLLSGEAA